MTYLYFYIVTRILVFLFLALSLRVATVSKESRELITWFFTFSLVPVGFELMIMFLIPLLLITLIWEFIENNIQYPMKWLYKILNGRPYDA